MRELSNGTLADLNITEGHYLNGLLNLKEATHEKLTMPNITVGISKKNT